MKSAFWTFAQEIYQEWYLGYKLFEEVEKKPKRSNFKNGYIYDEVVLRPVAEIKSLLEDLKMQAIILQSQQGDHELKRLFHLKHLN